MKYQLLPPLSPEDFQSLEKSILAQGVLVPVEYDEAGDILDGHHRVQICQSLDIDWPRVVRSGLSEPDKRAHIRALNLSRRHLTTFQKRSIVEQQIIETPSLSNRVMGDRLGVDNKTVWSARERLISEGRLASIGRIVGKNGKTQPARKPARPPTETLADGTHIDLIDWYDLPRRIAACDARIAVDQRERAVLKAIHDHAVPPDDQLKVGEVLSPDVLASLVRAVS